MKIKVMTIAMSMAILGTVSCSKSDLYDEAAQNTAKFEKAVSEYKANFVKKYGEVDPNQNWDFSNDQQYYSFSSSTSRTRAAAGAVSNPKATPAISGNQLNNANNYFTVQPSLLQLMHDNFKEGINHEQEGTYFGLNAPENDFYIQPIFMGQSGGNFELRLFIVDTNQDILIWKKWENMIYKMSDFDFSWHRLSSSNNNGGKNLVDAKYIKSVPIKISGIPEGAEMYFYLKITSAASGYNTRNEQLGSPDGYIREYAFTPDAATLNGLWGVNKNSTDPIQCKLIGCEDASNPATTDKDYNDVVFLMYGQPTVPQSFKVRHMTKKYLKRYMIEDLGDTNDTDFNDIVVDVIDNYECDILVDENDKPLPLPQYQNPVFKYVDTDAKIRALGGTLDIAITIGNTTWRKSDYFPETYTEMMNTINPDYNAVIGVPFKVTGYKYSENNISVKVYGKNGEKDAYIVGFPSVGDVPMMIATGTDVKWSKERSGFNYKQFQPNEDPNLPEIVEE